MSEHRRAASDGHANAKGLDQVTTSYVARIDFSVAGPDDAAQMLIDAALHAEAGVHVHLANAYTIALADANPELRSTLNAAAFVFPDGRPLAVASRYIGHHRLTQVRGPALFERTIDVGRSVDLRHFLLGSSPGVLAQLEQQLLSRYPGATIVGTHSPPFRALTEQEVRVQDADVLTSDAQIVWVGLGTPKQDFEVARLAHSTGLTCVAVGAAFDFSAGTKSEAPDWVRAAGLEWLFRLVQEPRRLWRRYLFGNIRFLWALWAHRHNQRPLAPNDLPPRA